MGPGKYELFADTDSPATASRMASELNAWLAGQPGGRPLDQDRKSGTAMDVEGEILSFLYGAGTEMARAAGTVLAYEAIKLLRKGIAVISAKYGVTFSAKAPDGQVGPAEAVLPK